MTVLLGRRAIAVLVAAVSVAFGVIVMVLGAFAAPASARDTSDATNAASSAAGVYPGYRLALAAPRIVVCAKDSKSRIERLSAASRALNEGLLPECVYTDVQAAVDAVWRRGTTIYVLPGRYGATTVNIVGDGTPGCVHCDLQLEGTGDHPDDVVIEGGFTHGGGWARRVGIHAERANGLYVRNLTTQRYGGVGIEVNSTDGFVLDKVTGRWNGAYGVTVAGDDHGVVADCTVTGNSVAGIATASVAGAAGTRPTVEVRRCRSYGNLVGYAGGDAVYVHDNDFSGNAVGISADSVAWQRHGSFIANRVFGNNANPYGNVWSGKCAKRPRDRADGLVCPGAAVPVGTGLVLSGGEQNIYAGNLIYDNWRSGASQLGFARGNRWMGNLMGINPIGTTAPNGLDFWWDGTGEQNCWQDNASSAGAVRSNQAALPDCAHPSGTGAGIPTWQTISACRAYVPAAAATPKGVRPDDCPWLDTPTRPAH